MILKTWYVKNIFCTVGILCTVLVAKPEEARGCTGEWQRKFTKTMLAMEYLRPKERFDRPGFPLSRGGQGGNLKYRIMGDMGWIDSKKN